jgi:hypothetical protein
LWSLLLVVLFGVRAAQAADDPARGVARAKMWEKAAKGREVAARIQERQAQELLDVANAARGKVTPDGADVRSWFELAGDAEWRAGELCSLAAANYERAEQDWLKAAGEHRRAKAVGGETTARTKADEALRHSVECGERAAQVYEQCAESLGPELANNTARAGKAAEKAAEWREKAAERGPLNASK